MKKRVFSALLSLCMMFSLLSAVAQAETAPAPAPEMWYKAQLTAGPARIFYDAMETLYTKKALLDGKGEILVSNEETGITQAQLETYTGGSPTLAKAFQDARDAFAQDHCDIFYVDFSKLTFRVGKTDGQYLAYINSGINENYLAAGFADKAAVAAAINDATRMRDKIVTAIKNRSDYLLLDSTRIVSLVHDALVNELTYTYPSAENLHVGGVYAMKGGKANCAGYSTSLKWILAEFQIPSVLVTGMAENSNKVTESHMWNYVQIGESWYAVDATWDDPMTKDGDQVLRSTYLLKGSDTMNFNHYPTSVFSPGGMTFALPKLDTADYGKSVPIGAEYQDVDGDLKVTVEKDAVIDTDTKKEVVGSAYSIVYENMTLTEITEKGLHLAGRFAYEGQDFQPWVDMSNYNLTETTNIIKITLSKAGYIQFCITEQSANSKLTYGEVDLSLPGNHLALTKSLQLPYFSDYKAPPFVRKTEPTLTRSIQPQKTHYVIEYDEKLVQLDETQPIGMDIKVNQPHIVTSVENLVMRDYTYNRPDGAEVIGTILEFDFIPDKSYQSYLTDYDLTPSNLVGVNSKKEPKFFSISATYPVKVSCPSFAVKGSPTDAFVIANPTLVVSDDMNIFEYDGGQTAPNALDVRLVATIPNQTEGGKMLDALGNAAGEIQSSAVYDLSLSCTNLALRLKSVGEYNVTIALPYPEGFHYEDHQNVQFKAYHYVKQDDGSYKTEELICRITPLGLEVLAQSFSPFAIVAVTKNDSKPPLAQTVALTTVSVKSGGGKVTYGGVGAAGSYQLKSGATDFVITADAGYEIDKLLVDNEAVSAATAKGSYTQRFAGQEGQNHTLEVSFIAASVKAQETNANFLSIAPAYTEATRKEATLDSVSVALTAKDGNVTITKPNDGKTYFYKTTLVNDAGNKPALGDVKGSQWTTLTSDTVVAYDPQVTLYVQVIATNLEGTIAAWGQSSVTGTYVPPVIPPVVPPASGGTTNPAPSEVVTAKLTGTTAAATVSEQSVTAALAKVTTGSPAEIQVKIDGKADQLALTLSAGAQKKLAESSAQGLRITGGPATLTLDKAAIDAARQAAGGDILFQIAPADKTAFTEMTTQALGSRPVLSVTATAGKTAITSFGGGQLRLDIPYTAPDAERGEQLCGVYVDQSGAPVWLSLSRYDKASGTLRLVTNHLSVYGVGYRSEVVFSDTAQHWASSAIASVSARGLLQGTGDALFSPNLAMTRGMFVTLLGRLAGADSTAAGTFSDVAAESYCAPYVAWATKAGITKGVGDGLFGPERPITRQEMATMMAAYLKVEGLTLPKTGTAKTFSDQAEISPWALEAVTALTQAGLLDGTPEGAILPTGPATRAEAAVFLTRYTALLTA